MMSKEGSHIPITPQQLEAFRKHTKPYLTKVKWKAKLQRQEAGKMEWRPSLEPGAVEQESSILENLRRLSGDETVLSEECNMVLNTLRDAACIGMHVSKEFGRACGLDILMQQNDTRRLPAASAPEFNDKTSSAAAVGAFVTAYYTVWKLALYKEQQVSGVQIELPGAFELNLGNPTYSLQSFFFYLGLFMSDAGTVQNGPQLVKLTLKYCEAMIEEIKRRTPALRGVEFFAKSKYQLVDTDFLVEGFEVIRGSVVVSSEFRKVSFKDIVGNHIPKHNARRAAQRLACYDPKEKKNPFLAIFGMQRIRMGHGLPGGGKTMQINATASLLEEYCKFVGIPFLFWPMPTTMVSTYQGGSGQQMNNWMRRLLDSDKVMYAPIDDAETNLIDRSRDDVSSGQREVVGEYLTGSEGATAVERGNWLMDVFTNLPEQMDPAVRSRFQASFVIKGAETPHDFIDQDFLWWRKLKEIDPEFVDMQDPTDYEYLADQMDAKNLSILEKKESGALEPEDERIRKAFYEAEKRYGLKSHSFFGNLYASVHAILPSFTSRDVRNIQSNVSSRLADFDLPGEWFEKRELFFGRPYAERVELLKELMRANMKGLSFADIRLRETVRYLNNLSKVANVDRERKIIDLVARHEISAEAARVWEAKQRAG